MINQIARAPRGGTPRVDWPLGGRPVAGARLLCYKTRRSADPWSAGMNPTHVSARYPGCPQGLDVGMRGGL